jgi:8-oxo-dGTP pyrophosphatase MutT (NUDIX family)
MEKSCGCIVFNNGKVLVEESISGFYGFPKGHIESGESEEECAYRETLEETGIHCEIDSSKKFKISYLVHGDVPKDVIYFIADSLNDDITIQEEEVKSAFWAPIEEVRDILTFDNLKELWDKVMEEYNG